MFGGTSRQLILALTGLLVGCARSGGGLPSGAPQEAGGGSVVKVGPGPASAVGLPAVEDQPVVMELSAAAPYDCACPAASCRCKLLRPQGVECLDDQGNRCECECRSTRTFAPDTDPVEEMLATSASLSRAAVPAVPARSEEP